jgi:hypothetical protein
MNPIPVTRSKLLFCEGKDEEQFFGALFKHLGRTDVQIAPVGGKHGFPKGFAAVVNDANFAQVSDVLVVRDADHAADGAGFTPTWQSVIQVLRKSSLPVPTSHAQFVAGPPRVAVFVMPDGASDGMLETLCWQGVQGDPAAPCVAAYFDCLLRAGVGNIPHPPRNTAKASVRVFLASRPEPDRVLGQAAQAGYLDWTAPAFAPLIALLAQL